MASLMEASGTLGATLQFCFIMMLSHPKCYQNGSKKKKKKIVLFPSPLPPITTNSKWNQKTKKEMFGITQLIFKKKKRSGAKCVCVFLKY